MFMTRNPSVREQGRFLFAQVDFVSLRNVLRCCCGSFSHLSLDYSWIYDPTIHSCSFLSAPLTAAPLASPY